MAVERLVARVAEDQELRAVVRSVCQSILAATEQPEQTSTSAEAQPAAPQPAASQPTPPAPPTSPVPPTPPAAQPPTPQPAAPQPAAPLPELDIGSAVEPAPSPAAEADRFAKAALVTDADLPHIEANCRLKAEGARWAATRQRRLRNSADFYTEIEPKDRDLIARAKQEYDCFLWMNHPSGPTPQDLSQMDDVGGCFESLAEAISVVRQVIGNPDEYGDVFERALDLTAEAHSALRVAIGLVDGPQDDDQVKTHRWLRKVTSDQHIFIHRYMRMNDPADPRRWMDIQNRIAALDDELQESRRRAKRSRNRIKKVRYHAQLIQSERGSKHDWHTIISAVEEMVKDGTPPSSREIRETLMPVIEELPDEISVPPNFQLVLREIDHYLAARPPQPERQPDEPSPEVAKLAELLSNQSLVLIGGERRPFAKQALEEALQLNEVIWVDTEEHAPVDRFEPFVARDDVAVVLLAIRWCSHSYGDVSRFCEKYDKPLVRLPSGYGPNQVAHQILSQCGDRLQ